jgi:hypothetical protein
VHSHALPPQLDVRNGCATQTDAVRYRLLGQLIRAGAPDPAAEFAVEVVYSVASLAGLHVVNVANIVHQLWVNHASGPWQGSRPKATPATGRPERTRLSNTDSATFTRWRKGRR